MALLRGYQWTQRYVQSSCSEADWGVPPHHSLVSHPSRARLADLSRLDASVPEALAFGGGASLVLSPYRAHSLCLFEFTTSHSMSFM
jgi:hypothetical protein